MSRCRQFALALLVTLTGLAVACGSDGPTEPSPLPCSFTLSPTSASIGADGGTGVVTVTTRSDCQWNATSAWGWITIASAATGTGPGSISYAVAPNTGDARTGTVTISGVAFSIAQEGHAPCTYDVSPNQQTFTAAGGGGTVNVTTAQGCSWGVSTTSTWLTIASGSSGQGNGTVSYSVARNDLTEPRTGVILVAGVEVGVGQDAAQPQPPPVPTDCQYSVAPVEITMHWHHTGSEVALTTAAGCHWTADSDTPWLNVVTPPSGDGSATIRFSMSAYTEESSRAAALRVRWPTPTAGQNVWVTQEGCRYAVSVTTQSFTADAGSGTVYVYGTPISTSCAIGCPWTATSQASWIRIVTPMPNAGDDRFTYQVDANLGSQERIGQILVQHRIITIRQAGR